MKLADHAEKYASLGWALVHLDGKMPIGHGWQRSVPLPPSVSYEVWEPRTGNMGLVLGPSGVIDYEMDGGTEEEYLALVGGGIPNTPAYRSGSGKLHILFRDPGGLSRRTRGGLELRAGPHQSVVPPSLHPETQRPYTWVNDPVETDLLDPPDSLLAYFDEAKGGTNEGNWREALRGEKLGKGQGRHASLLSYMGLAVNQFGDFETFLEASIVYATLTQDPRYSDEEIEQWAERVWNAYREEPGATEEVTVETASSYLGIRSLDAIQMRSVEFFWKPFLQRAAFHLLVGRKGAGKGSFLAWLAANVTKGDKKRQPANVLWIATEDSFEIDVKPRFIAQGGDPKRFLAVGKKGVRLPRDLPYIEEVAREGQVAMIVVDPIVGVIGGVDSNSEAPIVDAIGGLNDLADQLDLMVIGVRHLGKNVDRGILEAVLGSAAWVNTPRAVLGIAQEEDSKVVTLQILAGNRTRSRDAFDFTLEEAKVEGVSAKVSKVVPIGKSRTNMADVLSGRRESRVPEIKEWLIELMADGTPIASAELVAQCFEKFGVGDKTMNRAQKELKEEGKLRWIVPAKDENGQFAPGAKWYFTKAV